MSTSDSAICHSLSSKIDDESPFTGTDRGLLRSVLGPWSLVPKIRAPFDYAQGRLWGTHFSGRTHFDGTQAPPPKSESSASKISRHSGMTLVFKYYV